MTSAEGEPEGTAPSPDKSPPQREEGRPYYTAATEGKPGRHREGKTFWQRFNEELYADNSFTVTLMAIILALAVGAVLMVLGNQAVRQQWAYFFYQPLQTLQVSWDFVAKAYTDMF